ncbi:MAG: dephospho-CoA kinase [Flammeovirgaceae bacterium]|jgi:dephospho-CoA kinase|nr:dephospho-CoA kinase [Flammeovirgaceae bacterium]|tara:strand:- start:16632 stop:17246 length:615 start_codon:yes stop_codon:yes gene_type:complete
MIKSLLIGLTGGIGSGKSTVSRIFSSMGIPVYDADARAKYLMNYNDQICAQIIELIGPESYQRGVLNSTLIADRSFGNPEVLSKINRIVHPAVGHDFSDWVAVQGAHPILLKESALLFETSVYKQLDQTILVVAPKALRMARVLKRDPQRMPAEIESIMARQLPDAEKLAMTKFVIQNDEVEPVVPQVIKLCAEIKLKIDHLMI